MRNPGVTVEFVAITGALEMQAFRDLADQFLEVNPDVVVEIKQPNFFEGTPTMKDIPMPAPMPWSRYEATTSGTCSGRYAESRRDSRCCSTPGPPRPR